MSDVRYGYCEKHRSTTTFTGEVDWKARAERAEAKLAKVGDLRFLYDGAQIDIERLRAVVRAADAWLLAEETGDPAFSSPRDCRGSYREARKKLSEP